MYTPAQLTQEIEAVIKEMDDLKTSKLNPDWITNEVIKRHPDIEGADADFWQCTGRADVRNKVRARLNKYKVSDDLSPDPQLLLDGFERVQQRYLISEGEVQVAIRIEDCTDEQILAKYNELRAMGDGCYQHADELMRYLQARKAGRAA